MKKQRISEILDNLDDKIIDEATVFSGACVKTKKRNLWIGWTSVAAAGLILALAIGIPFLRRNPAPYEDTVDNTRLIEYENAYYEVIENNPEALEKFGLPSEGVSADSSGKHLAFLRPENPENLRSTLVVSEEETGLELLAYQSSESKVHRVFREGDSYYIVRFCNYLTPPGQSYPVSKAFEVYGIGGEEDIQSIAPALSDNTWKVSGEVLAGDVEIAAFYEQMLALNPYSTEEHSNLVFSEEGGDAHDAYAEDLQVLVIETTEGVRFSVEYYPSYGWMYFSATQTYYAVPGEFGTWLSSNMK